jgi:NADH:ubiquinone oxidoreductase subunit F (NADH-binding)
VERPMAAVPRPTDVVARLLPDGLEARESLPAYQDRGGYAAAAWQRPPEELRALVAASGLRGRGGSAFPAGTKWQAVAAYAGPRSLLVNGAETEPASRKDRTLLARRPHLVLEGALLAARAVGAERGVFYLHADATDARLALEQALREVPAALGRLPRCRVVVAPPGYVAGEETAAIQYCQGKAAKPTFKPPLPVQSGLAGRPTLVQNVETLANVPLIAREGAEAFRRVGVATHPGTLLVTLSGAVRHPGVYEVPTGMLVQEVLTQLGGGTPGDVAVQAMLPGGYFAGWVAGAALQQGLTLDHESLRAHGATLGAGTLTVVPDTVCGVAQALTLLRFFAAESVRQCGPCTRGTAAMAALMHRLAFGHADATDAERLHRYATVMLPRRGACGHLDGATYAARTALSVYERDLARHARGGSCGRPWRVVLPGLERDDADPSV